MRKHDTTEVLVVGAGPVGMFTALRLAKSGIGVKLIDQESCTAGRSYACALHPRTIQLLDEAGVASDAIKLGYPIEKAAFFEGAQQRAELELSRLPVEFPYVLVLEQKFLEDLLEQKLKSAGVEVQWNHRLADMTMKGGGVEATIEKLGLDAKGYVVPEFEMAVKKVVSVRADFVVGADGQRSSVRRLLDINYRRMGEPQLFVVYEFETETKLPPEIRIALGQNTTAVLWPFSERKGRWSFQWPQADAPADFTQKDRSAYNIVDSPGPEDSRHHLQKLLRAHAPWFQHKIKEVGWATDIQFEQRLAQEFGRNRAWLAGDAAHQTGPVGMQSMNAGFREGADLATKITGTLRQKNLPDLLEAYNFEHRAEWEKLLGGKVVSQTISPADPWVREHGARLTACIPSTGRNLRLLLKQLGLEFETADLEEVVV
jgi:2-polyprenyl-6-methoxyphenol hydroxylase-like FAD-dependent oxidoreductase